MASTKVPISVTRLITSRADFKPTLFDNLILQKGLRIQHETNLPCPCRGKQTGRPNIDCVDCNGSGLLFDNPVIIRGIIQSISKNPTYKPNGEIDEGTARLTITYSDRLAWMDRITCLDGEDVFYETIYPIIRPIVGPDTECSALAVYEPLEIYDIRLFISTTIASAILVEGTDYILNGRKIILSTVLRDGLVASGKDNYQLSIRYKHRPQYLVNTIDHNIRNTRTIEQGSTDTLQKMPLSCIIKKTHYIIGDEGMANFPENG